MQSLARSPAQDAAVAGGLVLPRALRRPYRMLLRLLSDGVALSPRRVAVAAGVVVAGATAAGIANSGQADDLLASMSVMAGIRVDDIEINGIRRVSRIDVLTNIDLGPDRSLFAFDVAQAREDLKRLAWVRDASVAKAYPDRLVINIVEREPFAIWQNGQALYVVGRDGTEIEPFDERYSGLPLVVGKGAAAHGAELIAAVDRHPELAGTVRAYVRVGDRRWNLQLANGITVLLPEFEISAGLAELARLVREESAFDRAIESIDLRLADRTVLRLSPEAAEARKETIEQRIKQASRRGGKT
ncbi:MAG: cell division protein FtsQ [Alphaproteobacteria bacterium]|nr:MAG: cell division protein FtsQ [Alphaproteobacteria bacterium]